MAHKTDWVKAALTTTYEKGIIPPLVREVVLVDGRRLWQMTVRNYDSETETVLMDIWDIREYESQDGMDELKKLINDNSREDFAELYKDGKCKLDRASLRININKVLYVIDWHFRYFTEEMEERLGFTI